jgi:hypothetical protein
VKGPSGGGSQGGRKYFRPRNDKAIKTQAVLKLSDIKQQEERNMEKNIWGIILIVLAVLSFLYSLSTYHEVATWGGVLVGLSGYLPGGEKLATGILRNETAYCLISLGLGIIAAVIGTKLLSQAPPREYYIRIDNAEDEVEKAEENDSGRWKF